MTQIVKELERNHPLIPPFTCLRSGHVVSMRVNGEMVPLSMTLNSVGHAYFDTRKVRRREEEGREGGNSLKSLVMLLLYSYQILFN